ncbi:AGZA family xanthine/uracil permease-like MFS transporter [Pullulanibacillus pueri]|uniref:Guanine/hypoxanthine permease PbuG n=1 Tax=Pullulanibacillus pueri TaxID=1437324 RepID=A0A8J2ZWG0_9BACL|nr:NCS2 family permease [Pullulanibacillus pueri]MBM7682771.1 AGZA family xanthine/uracil permease-like MFS transporter [Pullulanibacillus pueri]GGH83118.1 guanine/hypoxanthine permease PbuG [Pullulanibacillus pueri]
MKDSNPIARYFRFSELNTSFSQETVAGLTTFLAMAYILFVNPVVLGDAKMDQGAVYTATALSAAIGTLIMGILARYPIAIAPGMGLNAFFTYSVVIKLGIPWETALAGVFISGVIFVIITVFKIREKIINAIPANLKHATAAGIGLFIAFIGLQGSGIVVNNDSTLVALGDVTDPKVLLTFFGILVTIVLLVRNVKAAVFYGMIATAIVGLIFGVIHAPHAVLANVQSLSPTFGVAVTHIPDINSLQLIIVVLTFLFVGFFDTAGTLMAVANQAGLLKDNKLPRAGRALLADSSSIVVGSVLGTSSTTAYVESSSGVAAGGRTGFASVITGILFLIALFFSPLLDVITNQVTAPALIIVGVLMATSLKNIEWNKIEIAIPAFLTIAAMPMTYSITTGIALGFVVYPVTMAVKGRIKELHPLMYVLFVLFLIFLPFLS